MLEIGMIFRFRCFRQNKNATNLFVKFFLDQEAAKAHATTLEWLPLAPLIFVERCMIIEMFSTIFEFVPWFGLGLFENYVNC